ncbi:OLC1v1002763C1 [Oldenlandia corymbosa var. corymbosa]|uniref:OLC1v1002763C1 n=1 Tax=Oldenlandia corymbosa var. corymbosa TaxID=529605 RepID=A0AAV1D8G4_OLDCO|nr:OLC1v1002763C1 [Oldenlandia corymbosa var. corymbosa]
MDCVASVNSFLKQFSDNYDFGCIFLVFGSFKRAFELLVMILLFGCGLKVLNFSWFCKPVNGLSCDSGGKSAPLRDGICAKSDFRGKCSSKISSCHVDCLNYSCPPAMDKVKDTDSGNCDAEEGNDDDEQCDEDKEFDVLALRKLIKMERQRANSALLELEKERMSAAVAAEESMAMILRLQNEKSLIEMESNQYKRLAEEKLNYDQELIQSLQWLVMKHESDRTSLEDQLELSHKKLKLLMNSKQQMDHCIEEGGGEEIEESFVTPNTNIKDGSKSRLIRSLDLAISP